VLNFVLAESALEQIPKEIRNSPAVVSDSKRRGIPAADILLDRSFHHSAMLKLKDAEKRGRPDLVHAALLSVTGTPLYLDGGVRVFVHTYPDLVLEVAEKTRLPKNYFRFRGLMEETLSEKPRGGLVQARQMGMNELVRKEIRPDLVIGFSVRGRTVEMDDLASKVVAAKNPCLVVGGFPHGHFSDKVTKSLDDFVRIDPRPLEAHVVAARALYEVEKAANRIND
jgi:rRNA small subunit pseudouridine methyltransferase Nep1